MAHEVHKDNADDAIDIENEVGLLRRGHLLNLEGKVKQRVLWNIAKETSEFALVPAEVISDVPLETLNQRQSFPGPGYSELLSTNPLQHLSHLLEVLADELLE